MKLNLQKDSQKVRKYIERRIKDYPHYVNVGPGDDDDPIRLITLGYYAEQGGYVALVFDTRPDAEVDGQWTVHLDETTMLELPKGCDFYEQACEGKQVVFVSYGGTEEVLQFPIEDEDDLLDDKSLEQLNAVFGEMLTRLMHDLRDDGTLAKLPLAKRAFMVVEEFDGNFLKVENTSARCMHIFNFFYLNNIIV